MSGQLLQRVSTRRTVSQRLVLIAVMALLLMGWMAGAGGCSGNVESQPSPSTATSPKSAKNAASPIRLDGSAGGPDSSTGAATIQPMDAVEPRPQPTVLLDRVAVIGASATCGFGVQTAVEGPFGPTTAPADLATAIRAVFDMHGPVNKQCSFFFFSNPMTVGPTLMDAALESDPTIVFALDYLFWYGYGSRDVHGQPIAGNEAARLELLEAGFKQLER